jgi:hypothetical protein
VLLARNIRIKRRLAGDADVFTETPRLLCVRVDVQRFEESLEGARLVVVRKCFQ